MYSARAFDADLELAKETFKSGGRAALLDAYLCSIHDAKERFSKTDEGNRSSQVIISIPTVRTTQAKSKTKRKRRKRIIGGNSYF